MTRTGATEMADDRKALAELRDLVALMADGSTSEPRAEAYAEVVEIIETRFATALREEGEPDGWFSRVVGPDGPGIWRRYDGPEKPRIYVPDSTSWSVEHFPFRRHPHTEDESE